MAQAAYARPRARGRDGGLPAGIRRRWPSPAAGDGGAGTRAPRCFAHDGLAQGFTVLELMLGILIVGILAMLAIGQYSNYQERVLVAQAIHDIGSISLEIQQMAAVNGRLPVDLAEVGHGGALDPWGNAYVYTDLTGPGNGAARKDRRLNPLNSDFDLFSRGKDGVFKPQISHRDSLDDVIRASDGRFIDLAEKY